MMIVEATEGKMVAKVEVIWMGVVAVLVAVLVVEETVIVMVVATVVPTRWKWRR